MSKEPSFFKSPHILVMVFVIFGITILHFGCFDPSVVPDQYLGPIGVIYRFLVYTHPPLVKIVYFGTLLGHFGGAWYTLILTKQFGITDTVTRYKWFVQTLVFGIFSLVLLKDPKKKKE